MTPEQLQGIREAAEWCADVAQIKRSPQSKLSMCLHYILTTVHADDALPVTADWLREEYGDNLLEPTEDYNVECYCYQFGDNDSCLNVEAESRRVYMYDAGSDRVISELEHITTRHQFRQLAGILGIQPKK